MCGSAGCKVLSLDKGFDGMQLLREKAVAGCPTAFVSMSCHFSLRLRAQDWEWNIKLSSLSTELEKLLVRLDFSMGSYSLRL